MGTSIDLGLELVRILVSDKAAKDLAKNIQYEG
jgi:4-methyl-5(b-hydroxyethyl)-thiazole monophosphate biosynthesis